MYYFLLHLTGIKQFVIKCCRMCRFQPLWAKAIGI